MGDDRCLGEAVCGGDKGKGKDPCVQLGGSAVDTTQPACYAQPDPFSLLLTTSLALDLALSWLGPQLPPLLLPSQARPGQVEATTADCPRARTELQQKVSSRECRVEQGSGRDNRAHV